MHVIVVIVGLQRSFNPSESSIQFKTLSSLDKHVQYAMLPGIETRIIDFKKPLDGDQDLKFHFGSLKADIDDLLRIRPFVATWQDVL